MSIVIYWVILCCFVVTGQGHGGLGGCQCKARKLVCFSHDRDILPKYHSRRIETLDNVLDTCPNVILVKLLKLRNQDIQRFLSQNLTEVIFLEISYSKTFKLTGGMFNKTQKLKELTLTENKIHSLSENIFQDVKQLKMLNLNGNKLKALNKSDFCSLDLLQELHLRENKIARIENLTFVNMRHLNLLNLANNRLRHVTALTFRGLTQLQTLILSRNQIIDFHPKLLEDFISLRILYLTGNPLKIFPRSSNQLKVIQNTQRKGEIHKYSSYSGWPIGFWTSSIFLSSIFFLFFFTSIFLFLIWFLNHLLTTLLENKENSLRLYLLHAQEDSTSLVSEFIAQISQELEAEVFTREDAEPGQSVTQEAIRMVTESDVLVILISKHQDSLMDLVISRSGQILINLHSR